jgi:serine/threonine-protein kinase SRPK3
MVLISKVWDLFEGKHMFNERLPSREASEPAHLARMIALLGPPPKDLFERGEFSSTFLMKVRSYQRYMVITYVIDEVQETSLQI